MRIGNFICLVFLLSTISTTLNAQNLNHSKIDSLYVQANSLTSKNGDSLKNFANEVVALSNIHKYEYGLVKGKLLAALYFINRMKLDTAIALINDCSIYFEKESERLLSKEGALFYYYQAEIAMRKSKLVDAEGFANKALDIYQKLENDFGSATSFIQTGKIFRLQDKYPQALDLYLKALEFKIKSGASPQQYSQELIDISEIYSIMGQYDKALDYLRKIYQISNWKTKQMEVLFSMARIFAKQYKNDSAMHYFQLTKSMASQGGNTDFLLLIDLEIADLLSSAGQFKSSNNLLYGVLNKRKVLHVRPDIRIWSQLANNYLGLKYYDSAIFFGRKAYHSVKELGIKNDIIVSAHILANAFRAKQRCDSAYFYTVIYHESKDSVYSVENQRKLSSLYAEIETLAKQREIEKLEKQTQIDQIENRNLALTIVLGSISFISALISIVLFYRDRQKKQILTNLLLQREIESKNKNLHEQTLKMIYMNNSFIDMEDSLKRLHLEATDSSRSVRQLLTNLQLNKTLEKEWDNFNQYFGTVHGDFFTRINTDYPDLSTSEKRLASLIRMNLKNKEIAAILNIEPTSVKIAKYRLKKKLSLNEEEDIHSFLQKLS